MTLIVSYRQFDLLETVFPLLPLLESLEGLQFLWVLEDCFLVQLPPLVGCILPPLVGCILPPLVDCCLSFLFLLG